MSQAGLEASSVSAIIPVFNTARYLAEAIGSVLAQSLPPGEILVMDDGSTDDSAAVAESFGGRLRVHRLPHGGISATRNAGLARARGEWLAFLDADDVWMPDKLERQLELARAQPETDLVFGAVEEFISPDLSDEERRRVAVPDLPSRAPHCGSMLARRSVFERIGGFDTRLQVGDFIDWFARARDLGLRVGTLPQVLLRRRVHRNNTTRREKHNFAELAGVLKKSLDRRRQQNVNHPP